MLTHFDDRARLRQRQMSTRSPIANSLVTGHTPSDIPAHTVWVDTYSRRLQVHVTSASNVLLEVSL